MTNPLSKIDPALLTTDAYVRWMSALARLSTPPNTLTLLRHARKHTTTTPNPTDNPALDPTTQLHTLPSPFTRRPTTSPPYRPSPARPGRAAADRGRDLSQRWVQLERTLRAKKGLVEEKAELVEEKELEVDEVGKENRVRQEDGTGVRGKEGVETFMGIVVPKKPEPPADNECCMSGCAICVYDLYEDSLQTYDERVNAVQTKLRSLGVPEAEWPESIRPAKPSGGVTGEGKGSKSPVMSAFEELERKLASANG